MRRGSAGPRHERGQALVEFALVGVVFFLLVFGMIDVGRAVWNYNTLSQATREGARYAIVHGARSADPSGPGSAHYTAPDQDTRLTAVVQRNASGMDASRLAVLAEWPDGTNLAGQRVRVTSEYDYRPIFNFFGLVELTMSSSSTMEITN
jgi:Flp pilus assembly protein TadG